MSRREERDKKYKKKENKTIEHGAWSMERVGGDGVARALVHAGCCWPCYGFSIGGLASDTANGVTGHSSRWRRDLGQPAFRDVLPP